MGSKRESLEVDSPDETVAGLAKARRNAISLAKNDSEENHSGYDSLSVHNQDNRCGGESNAERRGKKRPGDF